MKSFINFLLIGIFFATFFFPQNALARGQSFFILKFGVGKQGSYESQVSDININNEKAITAEEASTLGGGLEYWLSPNLGLGLDFKKSGKRKTKTILKGSISGIPVYVTNMTGTVTDTQYIPEIAFRFPFKSGKFSLMGSYGMIYGKIKLQHDSSGFSTLEKENLNESGKRLRFGCEFFIQRESGFRLSYANYNLTWDESQSLALTGVKPKIKYSELFLEYLFMF